MYHGPFLYNKNETIAAALLISVANVLTLYPHIVLSCILMYFNPPLWWHIKPKKLLELGNGIEP